MPVFTSITRSGVRVTMPEQVSPCTVTIGGVQITLPDEAGPGIDLVASDVQGDVWAACTGVANDRGYLLKLSDGSRTVLPGQVSGRYPVWITEDGDLSWVPASDRMQVFHLDGTTSDSRDAHHPLAPNESDVKSWDGVEVVNVFSHGDWACATYAHDEPGLQTVLLRKHGGPVLSAGTFRTQLPPHCASHDDGSCTVAIQVPDGFDIPVFVRSEKFRPFVEPLRPMPKNPNRCAVVVDGEPNVPWFSDVLYPHGTLGILHHHNRSWDLERHKAMAREKRLPLCFYIDSHDPDDVFFPPMPEDIAWIPMVQCYPHFTESREDTRDRFSAIFWKAALFPRFAVYACGFRGLGTLEERTEQQLLNGLAIVAELAAKTPNCRLIVPFTWKRGANDGLVNLPRVLDAVRALQASVSEPDDYPTWAELKPDVPVIQPVTPKPPAPNPEPVVPNDRPHATKTTRHIAPGEILYPDTFIDAPGKGFRLYHQTDGQLVMLSMRPDGTSSPTGSTRTTDREPRTFVMQYEGNLVGYGAGKDYWASGIWRQDSKAIVTDAGQLVLEAPNGDRAAVDLKTGELTPIERASTPSQPHGEPATRPDAVIAGVGASEYGLLTNVTIDRVGFAQALNQLEMRHTRVGLMNAWSWRKHPSYAGTVDGLIPIVRPALDAPWNLDDWNAAYFDQLRELVDLLNGYGVLPVFTIWELYSWNSERKPTPVGQHLLPFQHNVNGLRWANDEAFGTICTPGDWLDRFIGKFCEAVAGTACGAETANESPEKAMHARIFDSLRRHGFTGPIQCNRHEDKPSQFANMISGVEPGIMDTRAYDAIAFHGRARMSDLDEHNDEPAQRPATFRAMFEHAYVGPKYDFSKIVFSSDGCRQAGAPIERTYDWDALEEVASFVLGHGCAFEHQLTTKMRWFYDGRIDVADVLNIDGPFLRRITR